MKSHYIALWDVFATCDRTTSQDKKITNGSPNDINIILSQAKIKRIFTTFGKNNEIYKKWIFGEFKEIYKPLENIITDLFSTSNLSPKTLDELAQEYSVIKNYL